jgi:hypothetical protein
VKKHVDELPLAKEVSVGERDHVLIIVMVRERPQGISEVFRATPSMRGPEVSNENLF